MDDHGHEENHDDKAAKLTVPAAVETPPEINFFGATNFRNQNRKFGIKIDDRRRHMHVVGKTGMGKTTLLENMVLNDIYSGHGVGLVDPHGDFAEKIVNYIPSNRINDVVYFNPADIDYPIGFNILETVRPEQKHLVASGLMGVFKKIWPDVWSARMEYILNNTILALLDFPGTTLLGINRMLADEEYRVRIVNNCKDPVVKAFWQNEFDGYNDRYKQEAVAPIQNKIGQFLSASVIRNIVAQVKSRIDIRDIMDNKKIFVMNLSKGRIGEDNSRLLGGMLITRLQLAAMERVDIPEKDRKDFFLYVDEFQNFATESFANILSEARKYRLDLIMAHQYMEQLDETVLAAVIGNVGTMVTFRVGSTDAEILAKEFVPTFTEEDLVNLPKFQIYLKLMIDGVASKPFSALTLPPIAQRTDSLEKVQRVSRERYSVPKDKIEDKIMRWSGMGPHEEFDDEGNLIEKTSEKESKPAPEHKDKNQPPKGGGGGGKSGGGGKNKHKGGGGGKFEGKKDKPQVSDQQKNEILKQKPADAQVVIVDTAQKGISLAEAIKPPQPQQKKEQPPRQEERRHGESRVEQRKPDQPKPQLLPRSEPEAQKPQPEPRLEPMPEVKSEIKPEPKPEPRPESKPEPKIEVAPEPKIEIPKINSEPPQKPDIKPPAPPQPQGPKTLNEGFVEKLD